MRLDDFYREVDDPGLPRSPLGIPDWDHIDSWDVHAAVAALRTLVDTGSAEVPDLRHRRLRGSPDARSSPVHPTTSSSPRVSLPRGSRNRFEAARLLADALCVRRWRWVTFVLRLVRDLAERRKPAHILLRRGIALFRAEPAIIAQARAHGARCVTPREAEAQVRALVTGGSRQ